MEKLNKTLGFILLIFGLLTRGYAADKIFYYSNNEK